MQIIVITGQTATGKTNLAIKLARQYQGELVNADSRQIYKGIDILTGKDIERKSLFQIHQTVHGYDIGSYSLFRVKLWLYDIVSPDKYFSSFDFNHCARCVIHDILERGKTPIIVGGTYLYIKHLLYGFSIQVKPDWELRKTLSKKTVTQLQKIVLQSMDHAGQKNTMNNSDWNNPHRLIRKIEILRSDAHQTKSEIENIGLTGSYPIQVIGLMHADREHMKHMIRSRVEKRLEEGVIDEVIKLSKQYPADSPGFNSIGFPQLLSFIKGRTTRARLIDEWTTKEMQYAQRQYTFMKKDTLIDWKVVD